MVFTSQNKCSNQKEYFSKAHTQKAQASVEYLILVGTILIIIAALAAYSFTSFSNAISTNQLVDSSKKIESAINYVSALGEGNSVVVSISLPSGVTKFGAASPINKSFEIETTLAGPTLKDVVEVDANVSNNICPPNCEGTYDIKVTNTPGSVTLNVI